MTGSEESAGRSSGEGVRPRATISDPRAATIAPLSVHRPGRGTRTRMPLRGGPLLGHRAQPGVRGDAAADQDVVDPLGWRPRRSPCGSSTSQTASWKLAATSATGTGSPGALARLDPARHRGLEAGEREVEAVPLQVAPRGEPAGEVDVHAVALARGPVDVRTARERQAEQPGHLVEGLPGGVVDRRAQRVDARR